MGIQTVKLKLPQRWGTPLLVTAAFLVSWAGWAGVLPREFIETWYSRGIFVGISRFLAPVAGAVGFSWLDVVLPVALVCLVWLAAVRRFRNLVAGVACTYLFFFFTWGLNYQRMPLVSKLDYQASLVNEEMVRSLREEAARQLNALFPLKERSAVNDDALLAEEARRVAAVVRQLDGVRFPLPQVKTSRILNPLFRAGGTSGMFNPFGYEALVTEPLLDVERPVVVMHEIAHVFGYANEGEANFIAFLGAIYSSQPMVRYSGWLYLWLYLRSPDADMLLDPGPRADLEAIYERRRRDEVEWVSRASGRTLDAFLRANRVRGGVRSYSEIVTLAVGTRPSWERFADDTQPASEGSQNPGA